MQENFAAQHRVVCPEKSSSAGWPRSESSPDFGRLNPKEGSGHQVAGPSAVQPGFGLSGNRQSCREGVHHYRHFENSDAGKHCQLEYVKKRKD
jgi:hypothetical protein